MKRSKKQKSDIVFKILILGNTMVGKSCLLTQFVEKKFHNNYLSTVGVDYQSKFIEKDDNKIELQIWDSAGQEKYRAISKQYYRKADGIILAFDFMVKNSFECIKEWLTEVRNETKSNTSVILIGNKIDLGVEKFKVNQEECKKFAENNNLKFFMTSAKTGENVEEAFLCLADEIYSNYQKKEEDTKSTMMIKKNIELSDYNKSNKKCCKK